MAIDQEIAQRVDAYRGNPQALQQRYAANQELLDLLALQRLKSEKDDAMRKVQMEMEQNPQTIKQQKERQLLEMTKQDLTNQTAGIMQNAQKKQQKNMQRVAKQGSANPQQVQKMQAGLGALAQRQQQQAPQQAPMRMAAGGIVAFAEGGITQADIDAYRRGGGQSRRARAKMTDDQIRAILERSAGPDTSKTEMVQTRRGLRRKPMALAPVELEAPIETAEFEEKDAVAAPVVSKLNTEPTTGGPVVTEEVVEEPVEAEAPQGIMELMQQPENQLKAPTIDTSGIENRGKNILEQTGLGLGSLENPNTAMEESRASAAEFLGRDKKRGKMDDYLKELKAMDVSQQDPKKLRDERISAFLRNAGGGSFGQTMAGGSQGMADERSAQEKSARDRVLSRLNIEKSAMDMDLDIAKSAQSSGDNTYAQVMANRRQASQVLASTSNADLQFSLEQAKLSYNANKDNVRNKLDAASIQGTNDLRRAMESSESAQRGLTLLTGLQTKKNEIFITESKNDKTLLAADAYLRQNPDDPAAKTAYDAAYKALQIRVNGYFEMKSDKGLSFNEVEELALKLSQGESISLGNVPTSATSTGFSADDFGPMTVK